MKVRKPGETAASSYASEVAERIGELAHAAPRAGDKGFESKHGGYSAGDIANFVLLGEARAIVAELTSLYWDHRAQDRARDWLRRYDAAAGGATGAVDAQSKGGDTNGE